jgi:hypothetical protein
MLLAGCGRIGFDNSDGHPSEEDGPAPSCSTTTQFLCEEFEAPTLDANTWVREEYEGVLEIDETRAHRGLRSLHARTTGIPVPADDAALAAIHHDAQLPSHVFIRIWVYQPGIPTNALYINPFESLDGSGHAVELRNVGGMLRISEYAPVGPSVERDAPTIFPSDRWVCLELEIEGLPASGAALAMSTVSVDDSPVSELSTSAPLGPLTIMLFGLVDRSLSEVWIDDVLIDTQHIGCVR